MSIFDSYVVAEHAVLTQNRPLATADRESALKSNLRGAAMHEEQQTRNAACQALASGLPQKAVFLDVGAMGGPQQPSVRYLARNNLITYVGIEPQETECQR